MEQGGTAIGGGVVEWRGARRERSQWWSAWARILRGPDFVEEGWRYGAAGTRYEEQTIN